MHYPRLLLVICALIVSFNLSSALADETVERKLRLHGSNTVGEKLAPLLIEAFLKHQGYSLVDIQKTAVSVERNVLGRTGKLATVKVELHAHGSSTGFKDLLNGNTDIAMSSRPIKEEEKLQLSKLYPSINQSDAEHVIAYDALAVIVHPNNKVNSLTLEQIAKIFSGELTNWRELGGDDVPITIVSRDDNSGTYDTFKSLVLKKFDAKLAQNATRFESSMGLSGAVKNHLGAIGFVGISHTGNSKVLAIAKELEEKGILPSRFTIGTEDYPLSRKLYLYLPKEINSDLAKAFVEFAVHEKGQKQARFADLISFYPTLQYPKFSGQKLGNEYANLVMFGRRLSVMFRFPNDRANSKTKRDLARLESFVRQNPHNRIVLAGFGDDPQKGEPSQQQVSHWVSLVEKELLKLNVKPWKVDGGFLAIENNNTESGKAINRRVEVWVL